MAVDREAALKNAEKALKQGRVTAAIDEYLKVVKAQPRDWNSANALGDLYVRAGEVDKGVAQYTRIADQLAIEGFFPKAGALYKKILKIKPADEYALLQTAEIGARQGLLVDAKAAYKTVADARRRRGDSAGAAEIEIRVGTLDPEDLEARLTAAKAASEVGDTPTALRELREVARKLGEKNRPDEALDVLAQVVAIDPADVPSRAALAQAYAGKGELKRASQYLDAHTAGDSAPLWLTLAEIELAAAKLDEGKVAVAKALALDASVREAAVQLGCRFAAQSAEAGYACLDAVADHAVAANDFGSAAAALREFATHSKSHLIALMRLVEVCVDGGLETTMYEAQAQLTDAYLEAGRALEARIISEDLVTHDPADRSNIDRFRRALVMLGEADPEAIIAERLSGESPFLATDNMDFNEGVFFGDENADQSSPEPAKGSAKGTGKGSEKGADKAAEKGKGAKQAGGAKGKAEPVAESSVVAPRSLDQVFRSKRDEAGSSSDEEAAAEQFALAQTYRDLGMADDAIEALQGAARSPRQRFDASLLLGQMYREKGELAQAVEWFERATEAPPSSADAGRGLLYDLAETLVELGEPGRALAVFLELQSEAPKYRDVAARVERLSTLQAKG
jgi:tetratricopeptide (TPR) repeat protein